MGKIIQFFKEKFFGKKLSMQGYYQDLRQYSKNQLRKELIVTAQRVNRNEAGVSVEFKKQMKTYSKKQLIRAILYLRLRENKKVRRLTKKISKRLEKEYADS